MSKPLMLDATPLGLLARRKPNPADLLRLDRLLTSNTDIIVPEVADFEVRRSFYLHGLTHSIRALDVLKRDLIYVPIATTTMLKAAELWAESRRRGKPTADYRELDCDVILAAQAMECGAEIATENVGHLNQFVSVRRWSQF
jgi:predicted nucleic acid-binding protein